MQIAFLHSNFPAQFVHLAGIIAKNPANKVIFITAREEGQIPGVQKVLYQKHRHARPTTHHYLRGFEDAILNGQAAYRELAKLKARGFKPDIIYGHSGWGLPMFAKDIFPDSKLICLFEWFYHAHGTDADFDPSEPLSIDDELRIRVKNGPLLLDLASCDGGICPTQWQFTQFPVEFQTKLSVIHDGIDTDFVRPAPGTKLVIPGLDLSDAQEIITYVARGMEPYRGFPQFIEAARLITEARPHCHVVIVGADRVAYGRMRRDGKSYKEAMLAQVPLDNNRVHFAGLLRRGDYLKVLQASTVHVYLTRPFVLSWSMLEAMAAGCLVVASDTPSVTEVITDGVNGLLVDFFSPPKIAERVLGVLAKKEEYAVIRKEARNTITNKYALNKLLPAQLNFLANIAKR